ncbi:hypothetical protein SLA2020_008630 [Shorea laevis]
MKICSLFFGLPLVILISGGYVATITVKNNCPYTIWPATLTGGNGAQLSNTGFESEPQACTSINHATVKEEPHRSVTLAEFTIAKTRGKDFFDVSLVDGYNVPLSITPQGGSGGNCATTSCAANINADCPSNLAVKGSNGSSIGCKSACDGYKLPQYCCTGPYNSSSTCKPTNYSMFFESQCPQAYSYAFDDISSRHSCCGGPNYLITFCP